MAVAFTVIPSLQNQMEDRARRKLIEEKGSALRGATLEVHNVGPVEPSDERVEELGGKDAALRDFFLVDVTVVPPSDARRGWNPFELDVIDPDEELDALDALDEDMVDLYSVSVETDGEWASAEEVGDDFSIDGPGRLLLLVGAHESVRRFELVYLWEQLGEIDLR